ncbi:MAG TPA: CoA-binding protein [Acidobacteriaceae bacterium]|nr:CoA-binding protein [Acidobacteriaceae bacterium]
MNEPETIQAILKTAKTIAVVGLSDKPGRPSLNVARYMQQHGYRIVPVNPRAKSKTILGEPVFETLDQASAAVGKIDVVDVFRDPVYVPEIVKDVIRLKIPYLWLQEGVCHDEAAGWAEADGIGVVLDRCMLKEHARWNVVVNRA